MAITIRDSDAHTEMFEELKQLTQKNTMSGCLIEGGYTALKYHALYQAEREQTIKLRSDLAKLERKVSTYLNALDGLRS